MSAISEYTDQVNSRFDAVDQAHDAMAASLTGLTDDVAFLKEEIEKLKNGPLSDEDKVRLQAVLDRASSLSVKAEAAKTALASLDAATERPPNPPA